MNELDFVEYLPRELAEDVFSYLRPEDLSRAAQCSRAWRNATNTDRLWLHQCLLKGWLKYGLIVNLLTTSSLAPPPSSAVVAAGSPHYSLTNSQRYGLTQLCKWKQVFLRTFWLQSNWQSGRYYTAPVLRGHREKVTAMDTNGQLLVTGGADKRLIAWNVSKVACLYKLSIHKDAITVVKICGPLIATGCADGMIHILDSFDGRIFQVIHAHAPHSVDRFVFEDGHQLISVGGDRMLRVWNVTKAESVHTLSGHTDDIECLSVCSYLAVTGSWDQKVIMWDISKGIQLFVMRGHTEVVYCCQFDRTRVVSGSGDGTLRIWSPTSGECMHELIGHSGEVYCLVYNNAVIASGSSDSTVRLWNHQGEHLHVLEGHLGVVRCLYLDEDRLVSAGDQKKIIVWDYKKGQMLHRVHRNPTLLHLMCVRETFIATASPERPGTVTIISYW